jgi:opacity protein-like surface antigen
MRFMKLGTLAAVSVLASATAVYAGGTQQNWTGFYVGGNFGANGSSAESDKGGNPALQSQFPSRSASEPGAPLDSNDGFRPHGGYQAGYNWRTRNSPFVPDIEGDQSR